jgi:hypothetical protein
MIFIIKQKKIAQMDPIHIIERAIRNDETWENMATLLDHEKEGHYEGNFFF